ncbi:hypothetical protein [Xanthobacter dioxanivorans]|nr:hypothetical protein [Xanthobacter dioxanivorans]
MCNPSCCIAAEGEEMQTVVTIVLIGSVMMMAIAALDQPGE